MKATDIAAKTACEIMARYTSTDVAKYILADFDRACYSYDVHLRVFSDESEDLLATRSTIDISDDDEASYDERGKPADQVGWYEIGQVVLDYAPGQTFAVSKVVNQLEALLASHRKRKRDGKAVYFACGN